MKIIAILFIALVLISCGQKYQGNAKIVEHQYDDPDDEWVPGYVIPGMCSGGYGTAPRVCMPDTYVPEHMNHRPERFILHVEWTDDKSKHHDDYYETSKTAYDGCPDGRTINLKSMQCPIR